MLRSTREKLRSLSAALRATATASTIALTLPACAADGAPIEGDLRVTEAGLAAPIQTGTECHFQLRPAWRQGVDCQLLVTCPGADEDGEDLFGGRRVGGYARCETAEHAFLRALDDDPLDGDPAIDLDLTAGTLTWRGRRAEESLTLEIVGETRPTVWTDE
ncbi:MAG: hypothetical protein K1X94_03160 [Sandaracinaceae bacterium]|nr:hypothetical protein [Sandaracinaceae bacterium]